MERIISKERRTLEEISSSQDWYVLLGEKYGGHAGPTTLRKRDGICFSY